MSHAFAAVDLGASSGRVVVGRFDDGKLSLDVVHRFPNEPVRVGGTLHWDILSLYRGVLDGLRAAGPVDSIGIDSWAVDYGLLDASGALLGNPVHYRDGRTDGVPSRVAGLVPDERLYEITGLQKLPFNTLYQLVAAIGTPQFEAAQQLLLIPDLLAYWLTGELGAEYTNASTTELLDVRTRDWSLPLISAVGLRPSLLPPVRPPGSTIGRHGSTPVVAVGSHDTASAVVGVPADGPDFAYISCGTWSLVGLELSGPVLTAESRLANFTNEGGVDGTIRFLKNVMGLWVLSESLRTWADRRLRDVTLPGLLAGATEAPALRTVIDIDDPRLLTPGDMPARIQQLAQEAGEPVPRTPISITRCIVDSLVLAYRRNIRTAAELAGRDVDVVHLVGGGSQNALLCQLTADALGVPVLAGPAEAAALGNGLVQARALGADLPDLAAMRALIRRTHEVRRFEPRPGLDWDAAESRLNARHDGVGR